MIRKQIFIDNDNQRQLKEVATAKGISESEVIRRAITYFMEHNITEVSPVKN